MTGKKFNRLTVIKQIDDYVKPNGKREAQWLCQCDCNSDPVAVIGYALTHDKVRSCGCLRKETMSQIGKTNKKYNIYDLNGEHGVGYTLNTNREFYFDLKNYNLIKNICWDEITIGNTSKLIGYNPQTGKPITMHELLGFKNYDHIDRNELNNLEDNLRKCDATQNRMNSSVRSDNTSGCTGVYIAASTNRWRASISAYGVNKYLGSFINKEDAIKARLSAEKEIFQEFSAQQHLYEEYGII